MICIAALCCVTTITTNSPNYNIHAMPNFLGYTILSFILHCRHSFRKCLLTNTSESQGAQSSFENLFLFLVSLDSTCNSSYDHREACWLHEKALASHLTSVVSFNEGIQLLQVCVYVWLIHEWVQLNKLTIVIFISVPYIGIVNWIAQWSSSIRVLTWIEPRVKTSRLFYYLQWFYINVHMMVFFMVLMVSRIRLSWPHSPLTPVTASSSMYMYPILQIHCLWSLFVVSCFLALPPHMLFTTSISSTSHSNELVVKTIKLLHKITVSTLDRCICHWVDTHVH